MIVLNTSKLKDFIVEQMTDPILGSVIKRFQLDEDNPEQLGQLGVKKGEDPIEAVRRHLCRSSGWVRDMKCRLTTLSDLDDFIDPDVAGVQCDPKRISQLRDAGEEDSCWLWMFMPRNDILGDSYRIEIVTDPIDSEILCWNMVVD